jgi:SAM-dependent methyltransferase
MTTQSVWQEVEFGSYGADLPLWVELADAENGPILELGAGAGRVALHLAGHGHDVIALERDPALCAELEGLAADRGISLTTIVADLSLPEDLRLPRQPALVIGPLHVIQILDAEARQPLLARLLELVAPGGTAAFTLVDESTLLSAGAASTQILPDMRELDGWVYSSEPLWVQVGAEAMRVRRLREQVSPRGQMERIVHDEILHRVGPATLEREAADAGFLPIGRRTISSGESEADSVVVLLRAPR